MKVSRYVLLAVATAGMVCLVGAHDLPSGKSLMHTNIAIVGGGAESNMETRSRDGVVIDSSNLVDQASELHRVADIEEDEHDRFITSRSGKPRPIIARNPKQEENWDEAPLGLKPLAREPPTGRYLLRKKRCGGGGGDDDDDDGGANRARRGRWAAGRRRTTKRVRKVKKGKKGTTTTVTKVIQNGQVVSETTATKTHHSSSGGSVVASQPVVAVASATAPVVHTIESKHTVKVHAPATTTTTAAQVHTVQPQVVQQPAAAQLVQHVQQPAQVVQNQPATVVQQTVPAS